MDYSIKTTNTILIPGNIYFTLLMKRIFFFFTNNMLGYDSKEGVNYVQIILRGFHRLDVQNKISPILGIYFLQDQNNLHSMFVAPKLYDLKSSEKCKVL